MAGTTRSVGTRAGTAVEIDSEDLDGVSGLTLAGGHADPAALAALLRGAPEPRTRVEEGAPSPTVR